MTQFAFSDFLPGSMAMALRRIAIEGGPPPGPELGTPTPKPVDVVIDLLGKRMVPDQDRGRLHKALDRADAPDQTREGMDKALGRAIRR